MPIVTKKGDQGTTYLFNGKKVSKDSQIIEAIGSLDELSSFIGLVSVIEKEKEWIFFLQSIQKVLYQIMAFCAGKKNKNDLLKDEISSLEKKIFSLEKELTPIKNFIIPQGTILSSWYHVLRTICRRAERRAVSLMKKNLNQEKKQIIIYLNRLSDFFYLLARKKNKNKEMIFTI